jgi:two-component system chemotaxis sensor kinase CheA
MVATQDIEEIRIFLDELEEGLSFLDEAIISLEENPGHQETLEEIFRVAHTIKGSAGFLDLKNLVALGHSMENVFQEFKSGTIPVTTNVINTLLECKDAIGEIGQLLGKGQDSSKIETEHLIKKMNSFLEGKSSAAAASPAKSQTPASGSNKSAKEFSAADYIPDSIMVRIWISQNELAPSIRAFLVNKRLAEYGEILNQSPSEEQMDDENFVIPESREIRYWIKTSKSPEEIRDAAKVDLVDNVEVISEAVLKEIAETDHIEKDEDASKVKADMETSDSVRIPVSRLDIMINLVGELVIANSGFMQIQNTLRGLPELDNIFRDVRDRTKDLVRISSEIQGLVMNSRLVPISQVFNRFKRFVRDYSTKSGKKIRLTMAGESTELDKKITDEIIKPLTHLVRNSLDHGLETTEERVQSGKPETGTLHLHSYQEGNFINIIIQDDGRGLNSEKILAKAIARGIVTNEQAMTMADDEIRNLIFHSGISTKDEIDEMSGRGVGMDVVKSSVEDLNGTLLMDSEVGKGTKITIKLPLTLAILNALIVKVGNEKFCIPMSSIVETQKVSENNFLTVDNNEMVRLREKLIPVIRLDKIFPPDLSDPAKSESSGSKTIFLQKKENIIKEFPVIVVDYMNSPIAILVDQFLNRQEVVIKSLSEHYRTIDGISGASILGDGSIILIIDVNGIIQIFRNQKMKQTSDITAPKTILRPQVKSTRSAPVAPAPTPAPTVSPAPAAKPTPAVMPVPAPVPVSTAPKTAPSIINKPEINLDDITAMTPDEFEMLEDLEIQITESKPKKEADIEPSIPIIEEIAEPAFESVETEPEKSVLGLETPAEGEMIEDQEPALESLEPEKNELMEAEEPGLDDSIVVFDKPSGALEEGVIQPVDVIEEISPIIPELIPEIKPEEDRLWEENPEEYDEDSGQILDIIEVEDAPFIPGITEEEKEETAGFETSSDEVPSDEFGQEAAHKPVVITSVDDIESEPLSPVEIKEDQPEESISISDTDENLLAKHAAEHKAELDELENLSAENFFDEEEDEIPVIPDITKESQDEDIEVATASAEIPEEVPDVDSSAESFEFSISEDDSISMIEPALQEEITAGNEEQRLNLPFETYEEIDDEVSLKDIDLDEIEEEMSEMENLSSDEPIIETAEETKAPLSPAPDESALPPDEELSEFEKMKRMIESGEYHEDISEHESIALDHFNKEDYDLTKLNNILEGKDQELVKTWLKAGNQHAIEGIKSLTGHKNIFPGQTKAKKYSSEKLRVYIDRFKNDDYPVIGLTLPMLPIHGMIYFILTHNNARNMAAMLYQTAQMQAPETIDFEPLMEVTNILGSSFTNSLTQVTDIPIEPGIPQILENNELLVEAMNNQLKNSNDSNILYIENEFLWGEKEVLAELLLVIPKIL